MRAVHAIKAAAGRAAPPNPNHASGEASQAAEAAQALSSPGAAARLPILHDQLWLSAAMLACTLRLLAFVSTYELNPNPIPNPNPNPALTRTLTLPRGAVRRCPMA